MVERSVQVSSHAFTFASGIPHRLTPPKLADRTEVRIADRQFQIQCLQLLLKVYPSPQVPRKFLLFPLEGEISSQQDVVLDMESDFAQSSQVAALMICRIAIAS